MTTRSQWRCVSFFGQGWAAALWNELLAMAQEEQTVRAELAADGSLFDGYHPRMEEVHRRNAARLKGIIDEFGWPGTKLVGQEGAQAAWLLLNHALGDPPLQRRGVRHFVWSSRTGDGAD